MCIHPCVYHTLLGSFHWAGCVSLRDQIHLLKKKNELLDKILSLNLSGYGSTPHDPSFYMLKAISLDIEVLYPLLANTHGFLEHRTKHLPKLQVDIGRLWLWLLI